MCCSLAMMSRGLSAVTEFLVMIATSDDDDKRQDAMYIKYIINCQNVLSLLIAQLQNTCTCWAKKLDGFKKLLTRVYDDVESDPYLKFKCLIRDKNWTTCYADCSYTEVTNFWKHSGFCPTLYVATTGRTRKKQRTKLVNPSFIYCSQSAGQQP